MTPRDSLLARLEQWHRFDRWHALEDPSREVPGQVVLALVGDTLDWYLKRSDPPEAPQREDYEGQQATREALGRLPPP